MPAPKEERNQLDEQMMRAVRRATRDAEAVLFLVDAGDRPEQALRLLQPYCGRGLPVAVVLNKARARAPPALASASTEGPLPALELTPPSHPTLLLDVVGRAWLQSRDMRGIPRVLYA